MTIYRMMPLLVFLFSCEGAQFKGNSKADAPAKSTKKSSAVTKSITATTPSTQNVAAETSSPMTENLPVLESPSVPPINPVAPVAPVVAAPSLPVQTVAAPEQLPNLVFGGSDEGSYHLGDGQFAATSECNSRLLASGSIAGTALEFHFRLTKTTTLNFVKFSELCGVDDTLNHPASVLQFKNNSGNVLQFLPFYKKDNAAGIKFGPMASLPAGDYMLMVNSGFAPPAANLPNGDYDDFLVGRIDIQGDAPITRLGIITRGRNGAIIQQRP